MIKVEAGDKELVYRFDTSILNSPEVRKIINAYIDTQRMNEINYKMDRKAYIRKRTLEKADVVIGRIKIPK